MAYPQKMMLFAPQSRRGFVYLAAILWGLLIVLLTGILLSEYDISETENRYYLLPVCFATGAVIAIPGFYYLYKKRFDPFHPLIFLSWNYFFPGFFVGGLTVALGLSNPYVLSLIREEHSSLPLTFGYVIVAFVFLSVGFAVPYAPRLGGWIAERTRGLDFRSDRIVFPALILMAIGLANTVIAFRLGILGFQRVEDSGPFDGIVFLISMFWMEACFLLWLYIFRQEKLRGQEYLLIGILVTTSIANLAFQGNRGSLGHDVILMAFAYSLSGRKITLKQSALGGVLVAAALAVGIIYGTTFRTIKGSDQQMSLDQYSNLIPTTLGRLAEQDYSTIYQNGFSALTQRIDLLSPLAVVVSNYEALAPYEEAWGIANNIYVDTVIFFIPRVIWPDKPVPIDAGRYGDLYFNFSENSFSMTPMGDLLRNFGPIGIPIGMFILGLIIRLIYSTFVEGQTFSYFRATMFYMLFSNIAFEGTFGLIIPMMFKLGIASFVGLMIVRLLSGSIKRQI